MNIKLLLALLLLSFLLASCTTGGSGQGAFSFHSFKNVKQTTNYYTGTDGLVVEFSQDAPPREVYEGSEFDVQAYIQNKGAFDVVGDYPVEWTFFADSAIVSKPELISSLEGSYIQAGQAIELHGKSYNYENGEGEYFSFNRYKAKPIIGNFQEDDVKFYLEMCYPYRTYFSDEICIDTDIDGTNKRPQVCHREDKKYSQGQGAPVSITAVESLMVPRGAYVQPQFIIHIKQNGNGIISFFNDSLYAARACGPVDERINESAVNKVNMLVSLGNDTLTCLPNPPYFKDGEMTVECILSEDKILGMSSNYLTNLNVELWYLNTKRFDVTTHLIRSKLTNFKYEPLGGTEGIPPWDIYHASNDSYELRCDYCARTGGTGPECAISDLLENGQPKKFSANHACVYTEEKCREPKIKEHCILDKDLCPIGTFCGEPEASFNPKANRKPSISFQLETPTNDFTWYCSDPDDKYDLKQSSGCTTEGYYAIINKSLSCGDITTFTQAEGVYNKALQRTRYTAMITEVNQETQKICIKATDKQGAVTVKQYKFP